MATTDPLVPNAVFVEGALLVFESFLVQVLEGAQSKERIISRTLSGV